MSPLPDILPIRPFVHPAAGTASVPGSKSLTNRALLLAALCEGDLTLEGALFSEDTLIMGEALRRLGFDVVEDAGARTVRVSGKGGAIPSREADLFVGLAGTAARFLTALCAAAPAGIYRLDGVPQMRRRPMKGLIDALRALGADVRCTGQPDHFPIEIHARGLRGGTVAIDASESSQMLSALMMVAPLADSDVTVQLATRVREPFVRMTADLLGRFGVECAFDAAGGGSVRIPRRALQAPKQAGTARGRSFSIEPDATAASYFLALPAAVGGSVALAGVGRRSVQGDIRFADILGDAGLALTDGPGGLVAAHPGGRLRGLDRDFSEISDTFLTFAALSPLLDGPTRITGIAHTRKQETDRVAGVARELIRLGQHVIETEDALEIHPRPLAAAAVIETYGDHRFAMAFGILGCHDRRGDGAPWLSIRNPACCAKTFPGFFGELDRIRIQSSDTSP